MQSERWWRPSGRHAGWLSIIAVGLVTLLPGIFSLPLVDRDEPRFARATVEMMEKGDWVIPWFNDTYRFDKPPLTYWWMRVNYWLWGIGEGGARFHSVVSSILIALILWRWGSRLFDPSVGWWTAIGWLSCFQVLIHGRLCLADMPMILGVTLTQWCAWNLIVERRSERSWWWGLWLSQAFAFLAKGPVGLLVPLISWGLTWAVCGSWRSEWDWKALRPVRGTLLVLAIVACWGLPALMATHGAYWDVGIGKHVVERGFESFNDRVYFPFFYFITIFLSLFPWSGRLPEAVRAGWRSQSQPIGRFLLGWTLAPILIFLFYRTQLPHYILPGFGGALLLIFGYGRERLGIFGRGLIALIGTLGMAVLSVAWLARPMPSLAFLQIALSGLGILFLGGALLGLCVAPVRKLGLVLGLFALGGGFWIFARAMERAAISPRLAGVLENAGEGKVVGSGFSEPSLVFYTGRKWDFPWTEAEAAEEISGDLSAWIVRQYELRDARLWKVFWRGRDSEANFPPAPQTDWPRPEFELSGTIEGFNFARFSWVRTDVYIRNAPKPDPDSGG